MLPDYELVYVRLKENSASATGEKYTTPEIVNPLAVISDLQTDQKGHLAHRLRALFYKEDNESRRYPMLFEVDVLPYGYCIETVNIRKYYATEKDECSPYNVREIYEVLRQERWQGQTGQTLQLSGARCYKHRLQVPLFLRKK
jgi:hypothetical protein